MFLLLLIFGVSLLVPCRFCSNFSIFRYTSFWDFASVVLDVLCNNYNYC